MASHKDPSTKNTHAQHHPVQLRQRLPQKYEDNGPKPSSHNMSDTRSSHHLAPTETQAACLQVCAVVGVYRCSLWREKKKGWVEIKGRVQEKSLNDKDSQQDPDKQLVISQFA